MTEKRPIVLVTGANRCDFISSLLSNANRFRSGVGFGVCHRLLTQLAQKSPPDASPTVQKSQISSSSAEISPYLPVAGATLILGCRSQKRAEAARSRLFQLLDDELAQQRVKQLDTRHGEMFRKNLEIEIVSLDLSSVESVFACAVDMRRR
jgi:3-keto steroid reductase